MTLAEFVERLRARNYAAELDADEDGQTVVVEFGYRDRRDYVFPGVAVDEPVARPLLERACEVLGINQSDQRAILR